MPSSNTSGDYFGYSGLSIDAQHPGTIMVTGYSSWWPDTFIWRSTDGGTTWKQIWNFTSYPNPVLANNATPYNAAGQLVNVTGFGAATVPAPGQAGSARVLQTVIRIQF